MKISVLDHLEQPQELRELIALRAELSDKRQEIAARLGAQKAVVSDARQEYESAKESYKDVLRASVLGDRSEAEVEGARNEREQAKEKLESEEELLEAVQRANDDVNEILTQSFNQQELAKRQYLSQFTEEHIKAVKKAFDAAAADYIALRYLVGRLDVAVPELEMRAASIQNAIMKDVKAAARKLETGGNV